MRKFETDITAVSFIKQGGTAAQFLKGNGSIDSNTYLTTAGTAANSTNWNGNVYLGSTTITTPNYIMTYDGSDLKWKPAQAGTVKSFFSLQNVTNESKATMFTNPTFTGNATFTGNVTATDSININGSYPALRLVSSGGATFALVNRYTDNRLSLDYNGVEKINFYSNGSIVASGEITAYSDRRLKSNIQSLKLRGELQPVTYEKDGKKSIGFIAQDVKKFYPELVRGDESKEMLSLNYQQLTAVLYAEIIQLKNEIRKINNKI